MKASLSIFWILIFLNVHSQDSLKIKQIDALVSTINSSNFPAVRDTLIQNVPQQKIKMATYLTVVVNGNELLKYVNEVHSSVVEDEGSRQMKSSNTFYYNHNQLIKVEEYIMEGETRKEAEWYYTNDKPLYWTLKFDKAEDRAQLLLSMSKLILNKVIK